MSPAKYTARQYQPGDEGPINALYETVTGRQRSEDQYRWQWLSAPGGKAEIWLIEANYNDGRSDVIGHHGIMPLRFSLGNNDIVLGKTENTMVLPEFRNRILYPRFEQRFARQYQDKFYALFSTVGSESALRQRKAIGYSFPSTWTTLLMGKDPMASLALGMRQIRKKASPLPSQLHWVTDESCEETVIGGVKISAYADANVSGMFPFDDFWKEVKTKYCLTPARYESDLLWRFWRNPYRRSLTVIMDDEKTGVAIAVCSFPAHDRIFVEDLVVEHPHWKSFRHFLSVLVRWAWSYLSVPVVEFHTTDDIEEWLGVNARHWAPSILAATVRDFFTTKSPAPMPRKVCERGRYIGLPIKPWYVTPMVYEGR